MKSAKNTIRNRIDDDFNTRYGFRAKPGDQFNCFGGGSLSALGLHVSEANCTRKGEVAKNSVLH